MSDPSAFWNRIAPRYARSAVSDVASYQRKLQQTQALLRPDMTMLEVGCGTGSTAIAHAPHVAHVRATDISARMLDFAREKAAAAGIGNVTFDCVSLAALQADPESFDVVLALSLLHLVADRDAALARLAGFAKPGGYLVTSTTCMSEAAPWLRPFASLGHAIGLLPRLAFFSRAQLEDSHRAAGLTILDSWQPAKGRAVFIVAQKA